MSDLHISWEEYHQKIEQLAVQIYQSNWQFNQIVCLAKGGLRIGDILARLYDLPLAILSAKSYHGDGNRERGEIHFSQSLSSVNSKLGNRILLVDDLVDSGITLEQAIIWLKDNCSEQIDDLKTAVIWVKSCSTFKPDYYLDYLTDSPWIHQPFEFYEEITVSDLATKLKLI
jgi:hypoxanthine phosphoribosyltransferase